MDNTAAVPKFHVQRQKNGRCMADLLNRRGLAGPALLGVFVFCRIKHLEIRYTEHPGTRGLLSARVPTITPQTATIIYNIYGGPQMMPPLCGRRTNDQLAADPSGDARDDGWWWETPRTRPTRKKLCAQQLMVYSAKLLAYQ